VLGYCVDRQRRALEVVPEEAAIVKLAFELYERTLSVALTAQRLNARGLTLRTRVAEDGTNRSRPFNKNAVHRLLRNPLYVGKVRHNDDLFLGEHEPIIDPDVFERVQRTLDLRAAGAGTRRPRRSESLLTGLLRCLPCDAAMSTSTPTTTRSSATATTAAAPRKKACAAPRACSTRTTSRPPSSLR
jgi:site-specific DNA recombinase